MRNREELLQLIHNVSSWERISTTRFSMTFSELSPYEDQTISNIELDIVDERLSLYLNYFLDKGYPSTMLRNLVVANISLWDGKLLELQSSICCKYLAKEVKSIDWSRTFHFVKWSFDNVSTSKFTMLTDGEQREIKYVSGVYYHSIEASEEWMDDTFPDWRTKYEIAESLDLKSEDRARLLLSRFEQQPTLDLPENNLE